MIRNPPGNNENQQDNNEIAQRQSRNHQEHMGEVFHAKSQQSSRTIDGTQLQENIMNNSNNNHGTRRTKWTKEMNSYIVWSYFMAIKTTPDTHRREMHDLWSDRYGKMNFSEQRICDQKRQIFLKALNEQNQQLRGNWLTQIEIDSIREEVYSMGRENEQEEDKIMENDQNEHLSINYQVHIFEAVVPDLSNEQQQGNDSDQEEGIEERIIAIFNENLAKARLIPFENRKKFRRPGEIRF